jgi:hypothetical protein
MLKLIAVTFCNTKNRPANGIEDGNLLYHFRLSAGSIKPSLQYIFDFLVFFLDSSMYGIGLFPAYLIYIIIYHLYVIFHSKDLRFVLQ